MQEKSHTKKILTILAVLIILAALGRVLTYQPGKRAAVPVAPKSPAGENAQTELLPAQPSSKYTELIGPADPVKTSRAAAVPVGTQLIASSQNPALMTAPQPYLPAASSQTAPTSRKPYPGRRYGTGNNRVVSTNFYAPDRGMQTAQSAVPSSIRATYTSGPSVSFGNSTAVQEERAARMLAPFSRASRQDQDRRNAQWAKLSAAIDRAVLQALMPKSKKEALLEKYAPTPAAVAADPAIQSSGLTGVFAPVGQALAAQKQEMMKNFASSFGGNAAQQAGRLMDSFASELGAALNTPGLTQAQASQRVKEISKKYQDKMNDLANKNQYDKFVADRLAQDNQQKDALHNLYPDGDLSAQINQYIDTASQQVQELMKRTDLSPQEQSAQYVQIEQDKRSHIIDAISQSGQSLNPFYQWENKQTEEELAKLKEKIENGEVESVARAATTTDISTLEAHFKDWKKKVEDNAAKDPIYGKQVFETENAILDKYKEQFDKLYAEELAPDERKDRANKLIGDLNRELIQERMDLVERMDIPDEQKQQALEELRQRYNNIK